MLNNINISKYINTNSCLNKINSTLKIITMFVFLIMTLITKNIYIHLIYLIYLIILIILSKIDIKEYIKTLKPFIFLLISIFVINFILKVELTENIINVLKVIEIVIYSSIITITTSEIELLSSVIKLLSPLKIFKININVLSLIFILTLKFIPGIIDSINKIILSLKSRGINLKKNKLLILKSIILPTFNLTLKKADDLALSMDARSYNISEIKLENNNKWYIKETIILIVYVIILVGVIICDI